MNSRGQIQRKGRRTGTLAQEGRSLAAEGEAYAKGEPGRSGRLRVKPAQRRRPVAHMGWDLRGRGGACSGAAASGVARPDAFFAGRGRGGVVEAVGVPGAPGSGGRLWRLTTTAMAAVAGGAAAGTARSLSRFRGCLAGALLGDCVGAVYEAHDNVTMASVLSHVSSLEPEPGAKGSARTAPPDLSPLPAEALYYTDDTAMTRALVQSLLAKEAFDEVDMAKRFAQEYKKDPDRGYGAAVITVFKKLLNPKCMDVFEPARAQFNGKGSYGNGGAMRVAGISLAYSNTQDVQKFARLSAQLTHASSLGFNGAVLQALAVHLALQGESSREWFLQQLLDHMEEVESDDRSLSEAREPPCPLAVTSLASL
ncbi:ADP-ribosylhydrolase ARH3 isoform X3 [Antechinus flavipes]|uniref:ADP-ribosylhydrolase ARH3 isoform X3 n=1 Tax=Antechinus flavipes TaxID=38775 RepID=UPI0022354947|nr:ADP-ribosylhydrolase ARH3 isoform X3 [Antechinus flavipes]